jgi:hypothetical protein
MLYSQLYFYRKIFIEVSNGYIVQDMHHIQDIPVKICSIQIYGHFPAKVLHNFYNMLHHSRIDIMAQGLYGATGQGCNGAMVQWFNGTTVQWCKGDRRSC